MVEETSEEKNQYHDERDGGEKRESAHARPASKKDLAARLEKAETEAAENYDRYLRAVAELENYKKRSVREKADTIKYGNETLLRDILPLMDSVDRAIDHACNSDDFEAFRTGLDMLRQQLISCLAKHGVEQIEAVGKEFDPNFHEAMMQVEGEKGQHNRVAEEFETGYLLNGRLLRPSKVSVLKHTDTEKL